MTDPTCEARYSCLACGKSIVSRSDATEVTCPSCGTVFTADGTLVFKRLPTREAPQGEGQVCHMAAGHLIAGASWFACILPKGHAPSIHPDAINGHVRGGICVTHGEYIGAQCPKWPECIKGAAHAEGTKPDATLPAPTGPDISTCGTDEERAAHQLEVLEDWRPLREKVAAASALPSPGPAPQSSPSMDDKYIVYSKDGVTFLNPPITPEESKHAQQLKAKLALPAPGSPGWPTRVLLLDHRAYSELLEKWAALSTLKPSGDVDTSRFDSWVMARWHLVPYTHYTIILEKPRG